MPIRVLLSNSRTRSYLLLGWPAGVEYPVVYLSEQFIRPDGGASGDPECLSHRVLPILILIATNSSTASAFTTSALQTGTQRTAGLLQRLAIQAANIRYANMNYLLPESTHSRRFYYFVRSYPSGSYNKIVMPSYKRLTQSHGTACQSFKPCTD